MSEDWDKLLEPRQSELRAGRDFLRSIDVYDKAEPDIPTISTVVQVGIICHVPLTTKELRGVQKRIDQVALSLGSVTENGWFVDEVNLEHNKLLEAEGKQAEIFLDTSKDFVFDSNS